ncbi:hypothetical protein ACHQM5_029849 [Ranunculus cassubicifolius]
MATITIVPFSGSSYRTLNCHNQNPLFYKPNILTPSKSFTNDFSSCKLVTRHKGALAPIRSKFRRHIVANSDYNETELASDSQPSESFEEAKIDLQLPRRSLLVAFTCNSCSVRTERLISRFAYEKGTIFVQCAGCLKHHKLVDNLQVVVEYNFLEEDRKADLD